MTSSFDWQKYIEIASELKTSITGDNDRLREAKLRCYVSRAYYGVFIRARNYLTIKYGQKFGSQDVHNKVATAYESKDDETLQALGSDLVTLCRLRNKADYHDEINDLDTLVAFADKYVKLINDELIKLYKTLK